VNELTHLLYSTSISSIKKMEFRVFISIKIRFAKEFWWEWEIPRKLLGDP